jgi:hypothetical protein
MVAFLLTPPLPWHRSLRRALSQGTLFQAITASQSPIDQVFRPLLSLSLSSSSHIDAEASLPYTLLTRPPYVFFYLA